MKNIIDRLCEATKTVKLVSYTLTFSIFINILGDGVVVQPHPSGGIGMHANGGGPSTLHSNVMGPSVDMGLAYDEAIDLEPIDFEHFVDEPDLGRQRSERMFRVSFGDSPPPPRGR